jgi:hypothetical protein
MEAKPASRDTSIACGQYGHTENPMFVIFGGNDFDGGHWVLMEQISIDATLNLHHGVKRVGTLASFWIKRNYRWDLTPVYTTNNERPHGRPTAVEPIVIIDDVDDDDIIDGDQQPPTIIIIPNEKYDGYMMDEENAMQQ